MTDYPTEINDRLSHSDKWDYPTEINDRLSHSDKWDYLTVINDIIPVINDRLSQW